MKRLIIDCALAAGLGLIAGPAFAANGIDQTTSRMELQNTKGIATLGPVEATQQIDSVDSTNGSVQVELVAKTHDQYIEAQRISRLNNAKREMGFSPISVSWVAVDEESLEAPLADNSHNAVNKVRVAEVQH